MISSGYTTCQERAEKSTEQLTYFSACVSYLFSYAMEFVPFHSITGNLCIHFNNHIVCLFVVVVLHPACSSELFLQTASR